MYLKKSLMYCFNGFQVTKTISSVKYVKKHLYVPYQPYLVMQFGDIYMYLAENPLTLHCLQDESFQKYRKQHVLAK